VVTGTLCLPILGEFTIQAGVSFLNNVLTVFLPAPLPNVTINFNSTPALQNRTVSPAIIQRGQAVTLSGTITEPDPGESFELEVDWGDGTPTQVLTVPPNPATDSVNGQAVTLAHTYEDTDPTGLAQDVYPVVIRWRNPGGGFNSDTFSVTVQNSAPLVGDLRTQHLAGDGEVAVSAALPPLTDPLTAVIDWGDGTSEVDTYGAGTTTLNEVHQYTANGTYPIQLTLVTPDGVRTPITTVAVHDFAAVEPVPTPTGPVPTPTGPGSADLAVSIQAQRGLLPGKKRGHHPRQRGLIYHLTVLNDGPDAALGVVLTDLLSGAARMLGGSASQGSLRFSGPTLTAQLGTLAAGARATLEIDVLPTRSGSLQSTASVRASTPDTNAANTASSKVRVVV
jgi:uncharacterized repeat protein (TIGR01451 family)